MEIRFAFLLFLFSSSLYGIDGTIIVLEAPLFIEPDQNSKVIQYYRKGQTIFIHSQEANKDLYSDKDFQYQDKVEADKSNDLFFGDKEVYSPQVDSLFYKTLTSSGRMAYILKEHVFLEYKDRREFSRVKPEYDNTDYRIQEPIPSSYPFEDDIGYRGAGYLSIGPANHQSYSYNSNIRDAENNASYELAYYWSKQQKIDVLQRFYFGAMINFHFSSTSYVLQDQTATQSYTQLYLGPFASYDVYKNTKWGVNIYTSFQVTLLDNLKIAIADSNSSASEERLYKSALNISPIIGGNIQWYKGINSFDHVLGFNIRSKLPKTYTATGGGGNADFWSSTANDEEFFESFTTELSLYYGIQSNY